jgi:hypothetical protein
MQERSVPRPTGVIARFLDAVRARVAWRHAAHGIEATEIDSAANEIDTTHA